MKYKFATTTANKTAKAGKSKIAFAPDALENVLAINRVFIAKRIAKAQNKLTKFTSASFGYMDDMVISSTISKCKRQASKNGMVDKYTKIKNDAFQIDKYIHFLEENNSNESEANKAEEAIHSARKNAQNGSAEKQALIFEDGEAEKNVKILQNAVKEDISILRDLCASDGADFYQSGYVGFLEYSGNTEIHQSGAEFSEIDARRSISRAIDKTNDNMLNGGKTGNHTRRQIQPKQSKNGSIELINKHFNINIFFGILEKNGMKTEDVELLEKYVNYTYGGSYHDGIYRNIMEDNGIEYTIKNRDNLRKHIAVLQAKAQKICLLCGIAIDRSRLK